MQDMHQSVAIEEILNYDSTRNNQIAQRKTIFYFFQISLHNARIH